MGMMANSGRRAAWRVATILLIASSATTLPGAPAQAVTPQQLFARAAPDAGQTVDHSVWDRLLKTYVKPGHDGLNRVDYSAFKGAAHVALKAYIGQLETVDPAALSRSEQFAFLANLYNAKTVDIVLDHYPVSSIKEISLGGGGLAGLFAAGPWKAKVLKIKGVALSLDDIEHGILRPIFKDPRVHYALNCASVGCPNLARTAFTGADLDAQLDRAAHDYVNSRRGVDPKPGGLVVSSIYDWYQEDFGGSTRGVIDHLRAHAEPDLGRHLERAAAIADYRYDWSLNDTAP